MSSPFQMLLDEFEVFDATDVEHLTVILVAMLFGAVVGYWVTRRRAPMASKRETLNRALFVGVTFPLVTCAVLLRCGYPLRSNRA
jgi:ABC-type proline/glycine betaine transport system permease subunit